MPLGRSTLRMAIASASLGVAAHVLAAPPKAGEVPPAYVGETVDGDAVMLTGQSGKAVVLSYWATWCTHCLKELPVLANLQKLAGKDHLRVIAVDVEPREVFRQVASGLSFLDLQLAYDPDDKGREAFGVTGIPHMVIVGRDGRIEAVYRGYQESQLEEIVTAINRATGATPPKTEN